MTSAPEAQGTSPPTTNSKNPALTRQIILREWYVASAVRTTRVNAVLTDDGEKQTDIGSHADTCLIGPHALIVHYFNCLMNVVGYDTSKGAMTPNWQTVSAAVSYDFPMKGEIFIIDIHQKILIDHLHNNLLCPIQIKMYDVKVNIIYIYLTDNPTDQTHSIVI